MPAAENIVTRCNGFTAGCSFHKMKTAEAAFKTFSFVPKILFTAVLLMQNCKRTEDRIKCAKPSFTVRPSLRTPNWFYGEGVLTQYFYARLHSKSRVADDYCTFQTAPRDKKTHGEQVPVRSVWVRWLCFGMKYVCGVRLTPVAVRCSLFAVRCSLFAVRCSLFAVRCSRKIVSAVSCVSSGFARF